MQIKLKNVRLCFSQNLFKAGVVSAGDKPAFGCSFLLKKDDPQVKAIQATLKAVAVEKWAAKGEALLKSLTAGDKVCLRDGDLKAQYDGFEGSYFIGARSKTAPLVIDRDRSPLTEDSGKPYAGCYVNCSIDIWAQDNQYGKRVNATLKGVQFFGDGDAFVGSAPASADDFDDLADQGDLG